ncbi:MAG TPA: trigger factor [Bacteroidales bacterium]|nr:trigger factor [Bacteroidales bacterium]HRR48455.1 trigger factor [Bacteroidales bacterium]HRT32877.1 trigger factor [Bacteroidales bacterium]
MRVTQKNIDDLNLVVTLNIEQGDYYDKQRKILNDFRRKAELKGFRKGMAPMSLIEKLHGKSALLDAVNDLISEGLNNFISENKLKVLGEPLPNEKEQKPIDWENNSEFEFVYDIALSPSVKVELSNEDKIPYYEVVISDEEKKIYRSNFLKQYGQLGNVDQVADDDFIVADLVQGDTKIEGTHISVRSIEDPEIKKLFIGRRVGDEFEIDVNKAFTNDADRASLLRVKKEELTTVEPIFKVIVKEIKRFVDAEPTQELFDKVFGEGQVKSDEEFENRLIEKMKEEFARESDYRYMLDARDYLIEKAAIKLPEDFLKRWLYTANKEKFTMEDIEKEFDLFLKDLRWQMIRQTILKEQGLTVTRELLDEQAKKIAAYQFAMYGIPNVPEEQLEKYAQSLLANEKESGRILEKVEENLVLDFVKGVASLDKRQISSEELRKMTN